MQVDRKACNASDHKAIKGIVEGLSTVLKWKVLK